MPAIIWFAAGALLTAGEVLVGDFFLLMLGGGAFAAAIAAALGAPIWATAVVFGVVSVGLLLVVRPILRRHLLRSPGLRTNADALVGERAVVITPVDRNGGQVRLAGGLWSATTADEGDVLAAGDDVVVYAIDGAVAVVGRGK